MQRLLQRVDPALVLDLEGSTARDHFANERNYLSWLRLSTTLILLGLTIAAQINFGNVNSTLMPSELQKRLSFPVGLTFAAIGVLAFLAALGKYFKNQRKLASRKMIVQAGWGTFAVASTICFVVLGIMIIAIVTQASAL